MKQPKITLNRKTAFIYKSLKKSIARLTTDPTDPTGTMTTNSTTVASTSNGVF